ncbi:MAG: hypothetical protein PHC53_01790 [Patescibacteria group bacterium]|nr:hypothetical protein [Patescibacteria group bacterium]
MSQQKPEDPGSELVSWITDEELEAYEKEIMSWAHHKPEHIDISKELPAPDLTVVD